MSPRRTIALCVCPLLLAGIVSTAHAQRAERREPPRQGQKRPDVSPRAIDRSDQGFKLRTPAGWLLRDTNDKQADLELLYINLPPGQHDAGSFRAYVQDLSKPVSLEGIARSWKKPDRFDQPATFKPDEDVEIDGVKALAFDAEGHAQGLDRVERTVIAVRGRKAYVFHASSPKNVAIRVIPSARTIVSSIRWTGEPEPFPEAPKTPPEPPKHVMRLSDGFAFRLPARWKEHEENNVPATVVFTASGDAQAPVFRVYRRQVRAGQTLDDLVQGWRGARDGAIEYDTGESLQLAGQDAVLLTGKTDNGLSERVLVTRREGDSYVLHLSVSTDELDLVLPGVQEMEQSFRYIAPARPMPETPRPAVANARNPATQPAGKSPGPQAPVPQRPIVTPAMAATVEAASKELAKFGDFNAGFQFQYPSTWKEVEPDPAAGALLIVQLAAQPLGADEPAIFSAVVLDKDPLTANLANYALMMASLITDGGRKIRAEELKIGEKVCHLAVVEGNDADGWVVAAEHRTQVYTFTFVAPLATFEAWQPALKAMIESLEWL